MELLPTGKMNEPLNKCCYCEKPAKMELVEHWQTGEMAYMNSATCGGTKCEEQGSKDFDMGKAIAKGEL